jgi:hypothetical protein
MKKRACLPVGQVLDTVMKVEQEVKAFYDAATGVTSDDEVLTTFRRLSEGLRTDALSFTRVCESLRCGEASLERAAEGDFYFLSVLAESQFYSKAGDVARRADPGQRLESLIENALALERDLVLFHSRFYGVSCDEHKPVFADLIQRGQNRVSDLLTLRLHLQTRR